MKEITQELGNVLEYEVVVVDDGSSDATYAIAKELGARVIRHSSNEGFGQALIDGFRQASFHTLVVLGASGQYDPAPIIYGIKPILEGKADITVGSGYYELLSRKIYNLLLSFVVKIEFGLNLEDPLSGFICLRKEVLDHMKLVSNDSGILLEILIKAKAQKWRIVEFTAQTRRRLGTTAPASGLTLKRLISFYKTVFRNMYMG